MKKTIISFFFLLLSSSLSFGYPDALTSTLPLQVEIVEPTTPIGGHPRTPVAVPSVVQDDHTLYFNNVGYDLTLVLLDEDGGEAYTTFIPAGTTAVVLPSTLSGEYELQLLPGGSFYFYTIVTL